MCIDEALCYVKEIIIQWNLYTKDTLGVCVLSIIIEVPYLRGLYVCDDVMAQTTSDIVPRCICGALECVQHCAKPVLDRQYQRLC